MSEMESPVDELDIEEWLRRIEALDPNSEGSKAHGPYCTIQEILVSEDSPANANGQWCFFFPFGGGFGPSVGISALALLLRAAAKVRLL